MEVTLAEEIADVAGISPARGADTRGILLTVPGEIMGKLHTARGKANVISVARPDTTRMTVGEVKTARR